MLKTSSAAEILNAIQKVARGELAIETEVDKKSKLMICNQNCMKI